MAYKFAVNFINKGYVTLFVEVQKILQEIVKKFSKELSLSAIIQFGSSTYSKKFNDIDLLFIFDAKVIPTDQFLNLFKLIKKLENSHKDLVIDLSGSGRKRRAKYKLTIVPVSGFELNVKHNPHDLFFFKNIKEDKNILILYGKNPFQKFNYSLTNGHLFEMLSVDLNRALRQNLDGFNSNSLHFLFKTFVRAMLVNKGTFMKDELLVKFKENYNGVIDLPKNSELIIANKIKKEDFVHILQFCESCLKYLVKSN